MLILNFRICVNPNAKMCLRMDQFTHQVSYGPLQIKRTQGTPCYMAGFGNGVFWWANTECQCSSSSIQRLCETWLAPQAPRTSSSLLLMIQKSITRQSKWVIMKWSHPHRILKNKNFWTLKGEEAIFVLKTQAICWWGKIFINHSRKQSSRIKGLGISSGKTNFHLLEGQGQRTIIWWKNDK